MSIKSLKKENPILGVLLLVIIVSGLSTATGVVPRALSEKVYAGWRSSICVHQQDQSPHYWVNTANEMSSKISNSVPSGVWIIGTNLDNGDCYLTFPSTGGSHPNIAFDEEDLNEEYLKAFDVNGIKVWLQVEPGHADVIELIDLVLTSYSHHPSVIGFGIDVEWLEPLSYSDGRRVTNEEAMTWLSGVKLYNSSYKLFLKHWLVGKMPTIHPKDLVFVDNSQGFDGLESLLDGFKQWGSYFSPSNVSFQIGYPADKSWWSQLADPPRDIGSALVNDIPNCDGVYWVDFTVLEVFPSCPGDVNGDGVVDIYDVVTVSIAFGSYPGHTDWNPDADLNNDNAVDIYDVVLVATNFGKTA